MSKLQSEAGRELIAVPEEEGRFQLDWQETAEKVTDRQNLLQTEFLARWLTDQEDGLLFLGFSDPGIPLSASLTFLRRVAGVFVRKISRNPNIEQLRERATAELEAEELAELLFSSPFMAGQEKLTGAWLSGYWQQLNNAFSTRINSYKGRVAEFFAGYNPNVQLVGRVFFHLVESNKVEFPFAFLATYSADMTAAGKTKHLPLKNALVEYGKNSGKLLELLSTVNKAQAKSTFIAELVESGEIFHPLNFSMQDAYTFLREIPIYEEAGILCRMPNWWKSKAASVKTSVSIGQKPPSHLSMAELVDFQVELSFQGEPMTIQELRDLLAQTEGLALIKGKWVEVNHQKLQATLQAYEQAQSIAGSGRLTLLEAMQLQLNSHKLLRTGGDIEEIQVTNGDWLKSVLTRLTKPESIEPVHCGDNFHAQLRKYQASGLSWLNMMKHMGLGACLADDMGLGKTVQIIALLNHIRSSKQEKTLLVVPASLIGNWVNELNKFAPSIKYYVLHPSENKNWQVQLGQDVLDSTELFITTYALLHKLTWLKDVVWDCLILDEAQAIKNPGTKQTKTVKQLRASYKVALTGTPIENRLADLWSLFDFLNKGLLGSAREFTAFTKQVKESREGYAKLRQVVSPFMLRRLKTDKTVINDLPEKIEMKTYSGLSKKQAALYTSLVRELKHKLANAGEGIERKGLVLSSIVKFKQICNHPDQYLGQLGFAEEESGKFARLREICETIYQKRERVLVFTQFKEITERLQEFLQEVFKHQGLVLHGETPVARRKEIVAKFQSSAYVPFLVLSIKAGGVGLNLTSANHVIHFDRWWNPAVENQATDRAFRIGQQKNVLVHKFITKGTIEEKIDLMIEEKSKLSQDIIPDLQESWITDMSNQELINLFKLTK